jgi:hypothetical protein
LTGGFAFGQQGIAGAFPLLKAYGFGSGFQRFRNRHKSPEQSAPVKSGQTFTDGSVGAQGGSSPAPPDIPCFSCISLSGSGNQKDVVLVGVQLQMGHCNGPTRGKTMNIRKIIVSAPIVVLVLALFFPVVAQADTPMIIQLNKASQRFGGTILYSKPSNVVTIIFVKRLLLTHWRQYRRHGMLVSTVTSGTVIRHPNMVITDMMIALDENVINLIYDISPKQPMFKVENVGLYLQGRTVKTAYGPHYLMDHKLYELLIKHSKKLYPFTQYMLRNGAPY